MPLSRYGTSICSTLDENVSLIIAPPSTVPRMIEPTVRPSIQPLAVTSLWCGRYSVSMPYLAGEYAAAPSPTTPYAISGCTPNSIIRQPATLMAFEMNITWPLGSASANAPTNGASIT